MCFIFSGSERYDCLCTYRISRTIRRTMIFLLVTLEKNNCLRTFNIHCFIRWNITLLHFATALLLQQHKYQESRDAMYMLG